jgi:hypothetical protein
MKSLLLSPFLLIILVSTSFSQPCGTSGPSQCTPSGTLPGGTFTPSEQIPCVVKGEQVSSTSEFNLTGGAISNLRIDSLVNLPSGLCWSTNNAMDTFGVGESGCIHVTGITYAPIGQYKILLYVTMFIPGFGPISGELSALGAQFGIAGFSTPSMRLIDSSFFFCPPVIDSQTINNPFISYEGINRNVAEVKGKLYFDDNQNQQFDIGENGISNQIISVGNSIALTDQGGNYLAYPSPDSFTIVPQLSGNMSTFTFSPFGITLAADSGFRYLNNDFGVVIPANFCDGTLSLLAATPPRPGFTNRMYIQYRNLISGSPISQTINLTYDARQSYVTANPLPIVDTINKMLTWSVSNINSGDSWNAEVTLSTPATVAIGTLLNYSSMVSNSTCAPTDIPQTDEESVVVGSYDPNDKAVSPVGEAPGGRILPSTTLNYTIRFQNTGTYLAENVSVVDTISTYLNLSTLKVLAASHNYEVIIDGRALTFRFNQINLPDSNSNEPLSHGYIKYSIQPEASFVPNSVVQNRADIYFDFNDPIRTNTTTNTADNFVSILKTFTGNPSFEIYPNPLSEGNWQLITTSEMKDKEAKIYNVAGRLIHSLKIAVTKTEIDAAPFSKGVYIIRVGNSVSKIIKL